MTRPLSREEVRDLDRRTIEEVGIPGIVLMENAGSGCARFILDRLRDGSCHPPVVILSGAGNNGGDGFVIARHIMNEGIPVRCILAGRRESVRPASDAWTNLSILDRMGVPPPEDGPPWPLCLEALEGSGLVVDAVFGTGLSRPLEEPFRDLIEMVNREASRRGVPVLAVDLPSGLDANSGLPLGASIRATWTLTFVGAKLGLRRGDGPRLSGDVHVVPISVPRELLKGYADGVR